MSSDLCIFFNKDSVSGIYRLAQRFLLELLTVQGSMRYLPKRGCNFIKSLQQTVITEFDVFIAFAIAKRDIARNLRNEDKTNKPHEKYKNCKLNRITLDNDGIIIELIVLNAAGSMLTFTTPQIKLC